jgi:hypothetical protein
MMQNEVLQTLADRDTRRVLAVVAKKRTVSLKDLAETVGVPEKDDPRREEFQHRVDQLKRLGLVGEEPSPVREWATLYITADGIDADRQARRLALKE